jgi:hypothetical protein
MSTVRVFAMPLPATHDRTELVFARSPLSKEDDFVLGPQERKLDPALMRSVGFLPLLFIDPRLEAGHPPSSEGRQEQIVKDTEQQ